ncbi:MAG: sensor histidine kinase [Nocardioides sp.]
MRRQIGWLTAATTSAVVLAFVIPLCLLVRTLAEDRALANADQEARNVAILVFGLHADPSLDRLVAQVDDRSTAARTSVLLDDGRVIGTGDPAMVEDPDVVRASSGEAFTSVDDAGARILVPVVTESGTSVVRTSVSPDTLHQGVVRAWVSIIALGAALLVLAVLIAARLGRRISTPVTDLATVAHHLREGDLDARADPAGPPETVELGVALNRLADRVIELLAAERAVVGQLSHRLRTPVTALRLDVESLRDPALTARLQEHLAHLQRTIDAIIKDARRPVRSAMISRCDAALVVRARVTFWSALAEDQGRDLTVDIPAHSCPVAVDASDLQDVVDILVDNVFAHTPEGVPLRVALTPTGQRVRLTVQDAGPGFAEPHHEGHEEPGVRPLGSTGLGLQFVRRTVAGFGGEVSVSSAPGGGARVDVQLPAMTTASETG